MGSDLTPEQLRHAAARLDVTVDDVAHFMRPADASDRMFPAAAIAGAQDAIRRDVVQAGMWERLVDHGVIGKGPTWDVRPPEPSGISEQGEPWHYEEPRLDLRRAGMHPNAGDSVIRQIAEADRRNLERLSSVAVLASAAAASGLTPPVAVNSFQKLIDAEQRELAEHRRIRDLLGPNRATRRRQEREARRAKTS